MLKNFRSRLLSKGLDYFVEKCSQDRGVKLQVCVKEVNPEYMRSFIDEIFNS